MWKFKYIKFYFIATNYILMSEFDN